MRKDRDRNSFDGVSIYIKDRLNYTRIRELELPGFKMYLD